MAEPETSRFLDALQDLMHAFDELQADTAARHLGAEVDTDEEIEITAEQDAAIDGEIATRVKEALSGMFAAERFETGEVAALISYLSDGLAEIDPSLFTGEDDEDSGR